MPAPIVAYVGKKAAERYAPGVAELPRKGKRLLVLLPVAIFMLVASIGLGGVNPEPAAAGSCPAGEDVPSSVELDQPTIDRINVLKPSYEAVGAEKDVPWSVLAGIDYRESGNDPNRSSLGGEPLGHASVDLGIFVATKEDALRATVDALRSNASAVYGVSVTSTTGGLDMQAALVAYGRYSAYKRAEVAPSESPYVMNQFDDAHRDMVFPSIPGETLAGDTDHRYGAYTVFARLGGSTAGGCGASSFLIVRIAQEQVGLSEVPDGCNCGPEIQKFVGNSPGEFWCADFVSWVYNEAGVPFTGGQDGGWRLAGVPGLVAWLSDPANGEWHTPGDGSGDLPRPGDVIAFGDEDHTGIVERAEGSTVHTIEGNTSNMVGRRDYPGGEGTFDPNILGWGRSHAAATLGPASQETVPGGPMLNPTVTTVAPGPGETAPPVTAGPPATQVTVVDGLPSNWVEYDDCVYWNWGVSEAPARVIHYCGDKINQSSGGDPSLWDYVVKHERCHARSYEGLEPQAFTDELATDECAARQGADTSWSPY